jgi:FkbM family methyltransferase
MLNLNSVPSFTKLTGENPRQKVVDIGARHISGEPIYAPLLRAGNTVVVGFEPDADAVAKLNEMKNPNDIYLPHAVADGQRHTLHICAARDMTSLLKPNSDILNLFHGFPIWGQIVSQEEIDTVRLDDIEETLGATFLQMDVQGAELMILQNAISRLHDAYVLHLEVEFLPLYENQPLFSEIEQFLRGKGFILHRFSPLVSRVIQPLMIENNVFAGLNQVLWTDAIFVRDFSRLNSLTDQQLLGIAEIAHDCYQSIDLALYLLHEYGRRTRKQIGDSYLRNLQGLH